MSVLSRVRRCDSGCAQDMVPLLTPPLHPDRWIRVPPLGWWVSTLGPCGREGPGSLSFKCLMCGQTARVVSEEALAQSA
jgi:hypothetical protein